MSYTTRIFCVGFSREGGIVDIPYPSDHLFGKIEGPTRYVGFAEIEDLTLKPRRVDSIQIAILQGQDKVTEKRKKSIVNFAREFIALNYPHLFREDIPVNI